MTYQSLTILLPCHGLEDFPVHHQGQEADNLLSAWTVLWHPALIASAGSGPQWRRVDDPPDALAGQLIAVPDVSMHEIPSGFLERGRCEGAVILGHGSRETLLALALEGAGDVDRFDAELAADFMALGYCFLQVELLTRQMRYASNLDEFHFRQQLVAAAQAAASGDEPLAREKLASCFGMLSSERDHYYSVDVYLLDLTLTAETTLGPALQSELARVHPINVLLNGHLLERMAVEQPASLAMLRESLDANRCALVGGEMTEGRWPLLDVETITGNLRAGLEIYDSRLSARPRVFGRRRSGLSPMVPQILRQLQFQAALHVALDGGRIPQGSQFKTRWEGADGTAIDAVARSPLDASEPGIFLGLSHRLGESMDIDHVATICLAHWPGQACRWYDELRRVSRHTAALGKFSLLDAYFRNTMLPGRLDRFEASQYRCDSLKPSVTRGTINPLSTVVDYWRNVVARRAAEAFQAWTVLLGGRAVEDRLPPVGDDERPWDAADLNLRVGQCADRLAIALQPADGASVDGRIVLNPLPASRRMVIDAARGQVAVDVPGCGFAVVADELSGASRPSSRPARKTRIASELMLKNDFLEVRVHPETGGLAGVRSCRSRGNLMSQQLGMRLPRPSMSETSNSQVDEPYTRMIAQSVTIIDDSDLRGTIESRGVLVDADGIEAARFQQRTTVTAGHRVVRLEVELEPIRELRTEPWQSYYACRFAWGDDTSVVSRSLQETRVRAESGRLEAPLFVEVDNGRARVAVLTGGLPFHRLIDGRVLDSLLVVRGESRRHFTLGLAVDVAHPVIEAHELLLPDDRLSLDGRAPAGLSSGWLFRLGVRNILVTSWAPLIEGGKPRGFRARLLETAGKATRSQLAAFRPIRSARQLDLLGNACGEFAIEDGQVQLQIAPCEWVEVEAEF